MSIPDTSKGNHIFIATLVERQIEKYRQEVNNNNNGCLDSDPEILQSADRQIQGLTTQTHAMQTGRQTHRHTDELTDT